MIDGLKITLPEFRERYEDLFNHYHYENGAWGSLHIILADGNIEKRNLVWCLQWAKDEGDWEGYILIQILMLLSATQIKKIYNEGF